MPAWNFATVPVAASTSSTGFCGAADVFVMPAPISSPELGAQRRSPGLIPRGLIPRRRHHGRVGRPTAICVKPDREGRGGHEYGWPVVPAARNCHDHSVPFPPSMISPLNAIRRSSTSQA